MYGRFGIIVPRNCHTLHICIIARISTVHQDKRSNDDQIALCKQWVHDNYDGPVEWHPIASQGSGEFLDRQELFDAEKLVESDILDLVVVEDLARICRRNRAFDFCELAEDHGVRLIAINDHIDTAQDDWRLNAFFATMRHQLYNKDTSNRIKRTMRNRFCQGGVFQCPIYGYLKPDGAKGDADVRRDPSAGPIYNEWFRKLEEGATYSEIADWLEEQGIQPGPYCRQKHWNGRMVARLTCNPILKGLRIRNAKESKRINKTGRRRCVKAPPDRLLARDCPHLRFIEPERYDRVIRMLQKKHELYARGRRRNSADGRKGISKKRTIWPGQHLKCGVCNRLFYWGGHGVKEHMMCSGCRDYVCWNAATFDGFDAARRLSRAILAQIAELPDFDTTFRDKVKAHMEARRSTRNVELIHVADELREVQLQIGRIADAIARSGLRDALEDKLRALMARRDDLLAKQKDLEREPIKDAVLPTIESIRQKATESIERLAVTSPEFGRLMHRLLPSVKVCPYRLCDGGAVVLRAKLVLDLAPLANLIGTQSEATKLLRRELTVDLFDPPQRVRFRQQVISLRADGLTERQIAKLLKITVTAAQKAAALHRTMEARSLGDPYVLLTEPPADCTKLRRHLHPRYHLEPLDGDSLS
jgi:DNA invertase Pin-like site-specific DNA recombinase